MRILILAVALAACLSLPKGASAQSGETIDLSDTQLEEMVLRSYQYVTMFNVNQEAAPDFENAGFKLDVDGGIRIVIAAEQPEAVPEENWLPINRVDMDLDIIMRLYAPDLESYKNWTAPMARRLN